MPHLNQLHDNAMPREAAVGALTDDASIEQVAAGLEEAGIDADPAYFFQGDEGVSLIQHSGNIVSRLFEADRRDVPITALREGKTLVAVYGVEKDDADSVRKTLTDTGVADLHYFGRWTYD